MCVFVSWCYQDESASKRPSREEQHQIKKRNSYQYGYGGNKLSCEEALQKAWRETRFPYTALRLPDVIGPCDNIGSFLCLQQQILGKQIERMLVRLIGDRDV